MRKKRLLLTTLFVIILTLGLSACKSQLPSGGKVSVKTPESTKAIVPSPESGKSTMIGQVRDSGGSPYKNTAVRLAPVTRQGEEAAFVLDLAHSPGAFTDDNGHFVISNIDPREYTVVVGEPDARYTIIANEKGEARTWTTEAGKILDIGTIDVDLNQ